MLGFPKFPCEPPRNEVPIMISANTVEGNILLTGAKLNTIIDCSPFDALLKFATYVMNDRSLTKVIDSQQNSQAWRSILKWQLITTNSGPSLLNAVKSLEETANGISDKRQIQSCALPGVFPTEGFEPLKKTAQPVFYTDNDTQTTILALNTNVVWNDHEKKMKADPYGKQVISLTRTSDPIIMLEKHYEEQTFRAMIFSTASESFLKWLYEDQDFLDTLSKVDLLITPHNRQGDMILVQKALLDQIEPKVVLLNSKYNHDSFEKAKEYYKEQCGNEVEVIDQWNPHCHVYFYFDKDTGKVAFKKLEP